MASLVPKCCFLNKKSNQMFTFGYTSTFILTHTHTITHTRYISQSMPTIPMRITKPQQIYTSIHAFSLHLWYNIITKAVQARSRLVYRRLPQINVHTSVNHVIGGSPTTHLLYSMHCIVHPLFVSRYVFY